MAQDELQAVAVRVAVTGRLAVQLTLEARILHAALQRRRVSPVGSTTPQAHTSWWFASTPRADHDGVTAAIAGLLAYPHRPG